MQGVHISFPYGVPKAVLKTKFGKKQCSIRFFFFKTALIQNINLAARCNRLFPLKQAKDATIPVTAGFDGRAFAN